MSTVDDVLHDIIASTGTKVGVPLMAKWLNNRYKELVNRVKFRHLRKVGELVLPEPVSAGTLTAVANSDTITPDSTASAAILAAIGYGNIEHWFLRIKSVWYQIESIAQITGIITLVSPYTEDSISDATYYIVKRYHSLESTARWTGDFIFNRLRYQLDNNSIEELDLFAPGRILVGSYPRKFCQIGADSNGYLKYEIYPPPRTTELISYVYWDIPTFLVFKDTLPQCIDDYVLKEGILIDVYRFEKLNALRKGNVEQSAVFANEEAKQKTIWEKCIKDAIRTSRGVDDMSLILQLNRGGSKRPYDERTAEDYVLNHWSR